jgi:hypothetical protein
MKRLLEFWKTRNGKIIILESITLFIVTCCVLPMVATRTPSAPVQPTADLQSIQNTAVALAWTAAAQTEQAKVTPTIPPTSTPAITLTPSLTFTPAPPPTATQPPLLLPRGDGFYLINVDIAPGIWRNDGNSADCYWSVNTATGDIIDNHFGQSGGTAYISPQGFQVEFKGCGNWTYIQGP